MSKAVYIGRFQPFHKGHLHVIESSLQDDRIDELVILVGSTNKARSSKNPYTFEERKAMIESVVDNSKVTVKASRDYMYPELEAENLWNIEARELIGGDCKYIVGYEKDDSSYYLKNFPELEYVGIEAYKDKGTILNATDMRDTLFTFNEETLAFSNAYTPNYALEWETFKNLQKEHQALQIEAETLKDYPYKGHLNCCCADSLVYQNGKVLLIKRNGVMGHGLYALAGGHKQDDETFLGAAIRELSEETNISVSKDTLKGCLITGQVFDHPNRNLGVTKPTKAFLFDLSSIEEDVTVEPLDDALETLWVDLEDLPELENLFHDDHYDIIKELLKHL